MKTFKWHRSLPALLAAVVVLAFGTVSAQPAEAATRASATAQGGTFRGTIYERDSSSGWDRITISGTVRSTSLFPATLEVRSQTQMWGSSKIHLAGVFPEQTTSGSKKVTLRASKNPDQKAARLIYRVCSETCSTWQKTPWLW
ncbi:MAG: hypothetical protein ACTHV2_11550 [Brachybacterium sp.]